MEAEDTVMSFTEQTKEMDRVEHAKEPMSGCLIRKQAEISFRAGIKEVVEWMNERNTLKLKSLEGTGDWFKHCGLLVPMDKWQAKLKEWGIEI